MIADFSFSIEHCKHCLAISPHAKHANLTINDKGEIKASCQFCERELKVFGVKYTDYDEGNDDD